MPALSNPSLWRTRPYSAEFYVAIIKPPVVFRALVNNASVNYPVSEVQYYNVTEGSHTDIQPGQLVCFGTAPGRGDRGRHYIRKAATANTIYIGRASRGVRDGEVDLYQHNHITVYDLRLVWAKTPLIQDDGTMFKDFDIPYTQGTPSPPVANTGPGFAGFVNPNTGLITVNFSDAGSFATAPNIGITSWAWTFPGGTPASSIAINPGNVTFPAGFRYARLTVTDENNKTHTAYAPIFGATETGANRPTRCQILNHTRRAEGQRMTIRLLEDLPEDDYPDGTLVMVWANERYGNTEGSLAGPTGRRHMVFIGWIDEEQHSIEEREQGLVKNSVLELIDVGGRLDRLVAFPQEISRVQTVTKWTEMIEPHIGRYVHYLLHWHSTALELADFTWAGTDYPFTILQSAGQSLYAQANQRCEAIAHRLTCNAWGQLKIRPDPQLRAASERTNTVIVDLTESDWLSIEYAQVRPPRAHWHYGAALLASHALADDSFQPVPVFCRAPGMAPGQGVNTSSMNYQLVKNAQELYEREGNRYAARVNAHQSTFRIRLAHGGEAGIDPAEMEWVRLTVSSDNRFRRGLSFTNERFLPVELSYSYDHEKGLRYAELVVEREVVGTPAVDDPPPEQDDTPGGWEMPTIEAINIALGNSINLPTIDFGNPFAYTPSNPMNIDPTPGAPQQRGTFFLATSEGRVVRLTFDTSGNPVFTDISPSGSQRTSIGNVGIKLVQDWSDVRKFWLFGENNLLMTPNIRAQTVSWQLVQDNVPSVNIADFISLPQRNHYAWLARRSGSTSSPFGGQERVFFYKTTNAFRTVQGIPIARYATDMTYSIAYNPHNPRMIYVSAGEVGCDAYIYRSTNGGNSFRAIGDPLTARGGIIWWNWSTATNNAPNRTEANLRHIQGLSSTDLVMRIGVTGASVNLATSTVQYPESNGAYFHLQRNLNTARYAGRTGVLRLSSNGGSTWSSASAVIPGGSGAIVRGISQFPSDPNFVLAYGYRVLAFTTNAGSSWTNLWGDYNAWRSANFGSEGETIVTALPDTAPRYRVSPRTRPTTSVQVVASPVNVNCNTDDDAPGEATISFLNEPNGRTFNAGFPLTDALWYASSGWWSKEQWFFSVPIESTYLLSDAAFNYIVQRLNGTIKTVVFYHGGRTPYFNSVGASLYLAFEKPAVTTIGFQAFHNLSGPLPPNPITVSLSSAQTIAPRDRIRVQLLACIFQKVVFRNF